jgi:hypothetical protein
MHDVTQREQERRGSQRMLLVSVLVVAGRLCEKERKKGRKE